MGSVRLSMLAVKAAAVFVVSLSAATGPAAASAQKWAETTAGAGPGDTGQRADAIVLRQMIRVDQSPARSPDGQPMPYNHPSSFCQTQQGTILVVWNGGAKEASPLQRAWAIRKPKGADTWSDPYMVEPDVQVDVGVVYQPKKKDSPIICGYWLGRPPQAAYAMRLSYDDGKTWTARQSTPAVAPEDQAFYDMQPSAKRVHRLGMKPPLEFPDGTLWFTAEICRSRFQRVPLITVVPPENYAGDPKGKPWKSIHPDVFVQTEGSDGSLVTSDYKTILMLPRYQFSRNKSIDFITRDAGKTWEARQMVPGGGASNCGIALDVGGGPANGWYVLASVLANRNGMAVYVSNDPTNRASWKQVLALHQGVGSEDADPNFLQTSDRKLHLLFTGRGSPELKYYVLDPDKLVGAAKPAPAGLAVKQGAGASGGEAGGKAPRLPRPAGGEGGEED